MPKPSQTLKISVIVPVYNEGKYIAECMDSIVGQSLRDVEIICIDDGSTDNSRTVLHEYASRDERIRVLYQYNQGAGVARNLGLNTARGEFVCFMDADDSYPTVDALEKLYTAAIANDVLICGGSIVTFENDDSHVLRVPDGSEFTESKKIRYTDYQYDFWYHRFIYQRKFLEENHIVFPPYIRYQDPPFFVQAMATAGEFYVITDVVYKYRYGGWQNAWSKKQYEDHLQGMEKVFEYAKSFDLRKLYALNFERLVEFCKYKSTDLNDLSLLKQLLGIHAQLERDLINEDWYVKYNVFLCEKMINYLFSDVISAENSAQKNVILDRLVQDTYTARNARKEWDILHEKLGQALHELREKLDANQNIKRELDAIRGQLELALQEKNNTEKELAVVREQLSQVLHELRETKKLSHLLKIKINPKKKVYQIKIMGRVLLDINGRKC